MINEHIDNARCNKRFGASSKTTPTLHQSPILIYKQMATVQWILVMHHHCGTKSCRVAAGCLTVTASFLAVSSLLGCGLLGTDHPKPESAQSHSPCTAFCALAVREWCRLRTCRITLMVRSSLKSPRCEAFSNDCRVTSAPSLQKKLCTLTPSKTVNKSNTAWLYKAVDGDNCPKPNKQTWPTAGDAVFSIGEVWS